MTKRTPRPTRYRSKPTEIEAIHWTGSADRAHHIRVNFTDEKISWDGERLHILAGKDGAQDWVPVPIGHWIVRNPGDSSDVWPVADDVFAAKYERVPAPIGVIIHGDNPINGPTTRPGGPPPAVADAIALRQAEQRRMRS